jgi:hypothetical protein
MSPFLSTTLALGLSCGMVHAAALVPVPTLQPPTLPAAGLEPNHGQAKAGILFLSPGNTSIAVTAQSVLYSPLGASLSLVASNPNPTVSFSDALPGVANTYTGADSQKWVTGIPRYSTANLAAVYPGINAQYTIGVDGALVLNLLCQPGVDPNAITFQIAQAVQIVQMPDGSLLAELGTSGYAPTLLYAPPLAFQTTASGKASRSVSFAVQSTNMFSLVVQGLDQTLPLQVAMKLGMATGPGLNFPPTETQLTVDSAGNTFIATTIPDAAGKAGPFPTTAGEGCGTDVFGGPDPCSDVAVYKYSAAGVLIFVTYLAGQAQESSGFAGLAPDGTLVVAGTTDSADFPVTAGAFQPVYGGPPAVPDTDDGPFGGGFFAARLDSATGLLLASTFLGGPNADTMGTAAIGADGSLYFLPEFLGSFSTQMPVTKGSLLAACESDPCQNGYVARLSPELDTLIYGTYLPGMTQATAELHFDGSVYYAGTATTGFPATRGAYQPTNAGGYDGILARLDPTGSRLLFATYFGGPETDWILEIAVAPDGSVWAAVNSFMQCCVNIQNQLIHLDASGARLLANQPIEIDDMVVDPAGDLVITAVGNFTASPDAFLASSCGGDAYVVLSPTGEQLFAPTCPSLLVSTD